MQSLNGETGKCFQNWANTYKCYPEQYFEPQNVHEIQEVLKLAKENNKKVKVVGNGHSPSSIACCNDYMISLKNFDKIIDIDTNKLQIKVEAGILITKLNKILEDNNMSLSVLGSISDQTIAGAISCGTHGTGINYGIISSYVIEIEMVLASGEIVTYSMSKNSELFPAVLCSLGCLGIMVSLKIQCEKLFKLHQIQYGAKLDDVLETLDIHQKASEHFRFLWYPHTDNVICYHASRSTKRISNPSNWFIDFLIGFHLLEFLLWLASFFKALIPTINNLYFKINSRRKEIIDISYKVFNFDCLFKQYVYEASIPIHETAYFLKKLKSWLDDNPQIKVHFPVEVRFVKSDAIWLSNSYNQDSCYINIIMFRPYGKTVPFQEWWNFYEKLMLECGGRPHWAKAHNLRRKQFEILYEKFDEFNKIRKSLDPNELFMNEYLNVVFN